MSLAIECKKQENKEKPWIFFEQKEILKDPFVTNAISKRDLLIYDWILQYFDKFHYFNKKIYTYFLTLFFKDPKENERYSPIYKAIDQVIEALFFIAEQNENFLEENPVMVDGYFLFPLIVFDGELISAKILEDGDIELKKINHISLLLNIEMDKPWIIKSNKMPRGIRTKRIIIDIVKKEYLEEFLETSFK